MFAVRDASTYEVVDLLLILFGLIACGLAVWRASLRDVVGTVLCGVLGLVLLVFAL